MNYRIINSGSDGNAVIVEEFILIDCGVSFQKLKEHYKKIKIVLLTHLHQDHFNKSTIKKLAYERPILRFACCEWLVEELVKCGVNKKNIDVLEIGKIYDYRTFKIIPIKAYHDVPNCGYRLFIDNKKCLYITDSRTLEGISAMNYDLYLVEANYEEEELKKRLDEKRNNGEYAYESRVEYTHLSKEQTDKFLLENMNEKSIYEYLHQHKER